MKQIDFLLIAIVILMFGLGTATIIDSIKQSSPTEVIINTTEQVIDLNGTNKAIYDSQKLTEKEINYVSMQIDEISTYLMNINSRTIQFYPRIQRKCRNPIEFDIFGSSMQPFLYSGDKFFVDKVKFEDIELGDVIIFEVNDKIRIHSVIAVYEDFLQTAGYNMPEPDPYISKEQVKYRYCIK